MNKVEKIRREIEKRYEYWKEKESNSHSIESESRMSECNHLLSMIIPLSDTEKDFSIKESVIPFGASDSELMEATYFIPQGYHAVIESNKVIIKKGEEPVSNDLEEAANSCSSCIYLEEVLSDDDKEVLKERLVNTFKAGAQWQKANLWKDAQSDDLPEIDREVIALLSNGKVVYAHRPQEYWDGKNITTGEVTRHYPVRHDKGGWNIPDVKFWLDCELFEIEE